MLPMLECRQCGWVPRCQRCDVSLTLHRSMNQLTCHYCGAVYQVPAACPSCGSAELRTRGYGTEKIEAEVRDIFPEARISRMDLDTTRSRQAYERIISDFGAGRTNLLIGTQMISKGLDFDKVSVVGILNADAMLNQPDFRAYEHAFMMMAQVSGRAGRRGRRGLVILQTRQPQLPLVRQVVHNDYAGLYRDLCDERVAFRYPPFCRLVYVYLKHRQEPLVDGAALDAGQLAAPVVRRPCPRSRQARCRKSQDPRHPQAHAQARARPEHGRGAQILSACPPAVAARQALRLPPGLLRCRPAVRFL